MSIREIKKTDAAKQYQTELLSKEVRRLKRNFANQISLFDQLIQTEEVAVVKQELVKLNTIFTELKDGSERLCKLVSEEEAAKVDDAVRLDRGNLEKIEKAVVEWLDAHDKMERRSCRSSVSRKSAHRVGTGWNVPDTDPRTMEIDEKERKSYHQTN